MNEEREIVLQRQLYGMIILNIILITLMVCVSALLLFAPSEPIQANLEEVEEVITLEQNVAVPLEKEQLQEVYVTNYYEGTDKTTSRTGSGLKTTDFEVNPKGWYTYNGKVVVATATYQGLNSNYGVLANYKETVDGITYYNYFDEITLVIDDMEYEAIVLDTCGASHDIEYLNEVDNGLNRIDIFIADRSNAFGKVKGIVK